MKSATTLTGCVRLFALVVLSIGLFVAPTGAQTTPVGLVIAWGCSGGPSQAPCAVPIATVSGSTAIAASENDSLALSLNGGVIAWGCAGTTDNGQCTVPAAAASGVTAIAASFNHSLALKTNGSVVAWGCRNIDFTQCNVPAAAASGVTAIAAGAYHSLALKQDGGVLAWGCGVSYVDAGQCNVPAAAAAGVTAIAASYFHSLALKQDGSVVGWGCGSISGNSNDWGQCAVPAAAATGVTAISAGLYDSLALKDGGVLAWGCQLANFGQCSVPAAATSGVKAIAAGPYSSVAVKDDGSLVVWGSCGAICTVPESAASGVTSVAVGNFHALALRAAGDDRADLSLVQSALADSLQVGDTVTYDFTVANAGPQSAQHVLLHDVLPLGLSFQDFGTSSGGPSCAFNEVRHTLDCSWASVASGATGNAQIRLTVNQPGTLVNPATVRSDTIDPNAANNTSTATVDVNLSPHTRGIVAVWGCAAEPTWGQCNVPSGLSGVTAIAAGNGHSLALKNDGTVVAWGCSGVSDRGQCSVPSGLSGVTAISGSTYHSLALKADGTVVAWGCINGLDAGQCAVPALSGVTAIAAGRFHSLALKSDGTVAAWGCGPNFDLGQCSVPAGLSGVTAIAAGDYASLALKSDGTVVAWGCSNFSGGFGPCTVPAGLQGVTAIAAGQTHGLALKSDGTVVTWGFCPGNCAVPSGLSGVTAISAGAFHSMALKSDGTVVAWGCTSGSFGDAGQCAVPGGLRGVTAIAAGYSHSLALIGRTVPDVPTGVSAAAGVGQATVTWTAPASDGGSAISGYDVTRYVGGVAQGTTPVGAVTAATVTGLTNGVAYTFKVAAESAVGTGPRSAESNAATPRTVPDAPTGVSATAAAGQATVSWAAPAFNGGSVVTGYEVTRYVGSVAQGSSTVGAVAEATVTGLTDGTSYTFKVAATNVAGTGAQSAASNAVIPRAVPGSPTNVTATADAGQATVSWTAPASDGGGAITGYEITRYVDGAAHGTTAVGAVTQATVIGLTNGTTYTFKVAAKNVAGTGASSAESNAVTPRTVPDAPVAVSAAAAAGQATVSWGAPGFNGGSPITGYVVTRYVGGTAEGTTIFGLVTQATVTGLTNGTTYTFRVAAKNAIGTGGQSAETNAVTPAVGRFTLAVAKSGTGSGTVTSSVGGIACGATCAADLEAGTTVTLTASPAAGSTFAGWSGACSGTGACTLTVDAAKTATAAFNQVLRPASCVVPNVKRKTLAAAKRLIARAHCVTGTITKARSKTVAKGRVISQRPKAGTKLASGAKVKLVVSRGKR